MPKEIIIRKVELENFLCYTDPFEYEFRNGLSLICGINGKGKTSLMESLPYTFYGSTSKGIEGDDVINKKVKKNCRTTVFFDIVNQGRLESYTLSRYRNHKKFGTTAILDGPVKAEGAREVKTKIESLILPQKLFLNTVFFGQKVKDFFTALPDSQKKDIFRKVLQLDDFIEYAKSAKKKDEIMQETLASIDQKIIILQSLIEERKERIKTLLEDKKKFIDDKTHKIIALNLEIESINYMIKEKQQSIKDVCSDLNEKGIKERLLQIDQELSTLGASQANEINLVNEKKDLKLQQLALQAKQETDKANTQILERLNKETKELVKTQQDLTKAISDLENDLYKITQDLKSLTKEKQSTLQEITKLDEAINIESPICPTCGKPLEEEVKQKLINSLTELKSTLESLSNTIHSSLALQKDLQSKQNLSKNLLSETSMNIENISTSLERERENLFSSINQRLREAQLKLDEMCKNMLDGIEQKFSKQKELLIDEKNELSSKLEIFTEIESINKEIETLSKLKDEKKTRISMLEDQIFDESQIESTKHQQKESQAEIDILKESKKDLIKRVNAISFWKSGFSPTGIPSMLIDESIPFMNDNICEYMEKISGGRYTVSFDTLGETKSGEMRDKISIHFLDSITQNNCTATMSGGQERIVDVATILTLNDLQTLMYDTKFNILIFDEIFDSLDVENTEKIAGLLKSISNNKSVNIISHTQVNQLEPDRTLNLNTGTLTT